MSVNSWLSLRLGWSRLYSFPIPNPFSPRNSRLKIQSQKNFGNFVPNFREWVAKTKNYKLKTKPEQI